MGFYPIIMLTLAHMFEVFIAHKALCYRMGCSRDSQFPVLGLVQGKTGLQAENVGSSVRWELALSPYDLENL